MKSAIFDPHEKAAWLPPPEEAIDAWAERCIVLPRIVSSSPGPLSLDITPYIRAPLRAVSDPAVEEITLCCSTQVMKTTYLIIVALHTIAVDPWNCMHVMPTEDDAEDLNVERYQPIIRESPELAKYLTGAKHDTCRDSLRLNGCVITFRGAHSPAGLASRPVARLFCDEVDKWPEWSGKEADPIKLARERTRTFYSRKIIDSSSPTTAQRYIWPRLLASTNERYHVPCPHCGAFQVLVMGGRGEDGPGIKWPAETAAEVIQRDRLAWYQCERCRGRIEDRDKPVMLRKGVWCPEEQKVLSDGTLSGPTPPRRHVGYHLWAAYSPWLTFSEIAAEFLRSHKAQSALMNFRNSWQAEPWELIVGEIQDGHIRLCAEPYKQGTAPVGAWHMTVGVDVQRVGSQVYQYFVIRAWGKEGESWLVRAGSSSDWQALYRALFLSQYRTQDGTVLPLLIVVVDSGYETDQVYEFCEVNGCWASKGDVRMDKTFAMSETEAVKGSGRWLRRVNLNSDRFKGHVHNLIRAGRWHIPEDVSDEYFEHMIAEQQVSLPDKKTGKARYQWKVMHERPNHYFDCEILALLGAEMLELQHLAEQPQREVPKPGGASPWQPAERIVSRVFT